MFFNHPLVSGRSAAWLARLPWEQEVAGSNPAAPTIFPCIPLLIDVFCTFAKNYGIINR